MEQDPKPKVPEPYKARRFFVGGLDTLVGNELVERLRNEHLHPESPNQIVGTLVHQNNSQVEKIPQGVRKVINTSKVSFTKEVILDSDVIIYDLNSCPHNEIEFAISALRMVETDEQKVLICISSVMTWAMTPKKIKGEEDEADEPEPESEDDPSPEAELNEAQEGAEEPKEYVKFRDSDYALRRPLPSFQTVKSLQTLCLSAGKVRPSLKSYVICAGILYGKRQPFWQKYFLEAIHQTPSQLSYFGKGRNRIPSIHVKDLVTFVEKTIQRLPPIPYILAIDHNLKPSQKSIIKSISKGIGTGRTKRAQIESVEDVPQFLTADIGMRPTQYFQKLQQDQSGLEGEDGEEVQKFTFKWQYKEGIQPNIKRLSEQFKASMSIRQIKVFLTGPPASGKSYYSEKLANIYKLPHLHAKKVIDEVLALGDENQLASEVKAYLEEQKQTLVQEAQTKYEEMKQKWKKLPKGERQPLEPFQEDSVKVYLGDELLSKCYVWRLSQNDCINRGYILDGFPKSYDNAKAIFMFTPEPQEGEQVDQEHPTRIVNPTSVPNKVFAFQMTDQQILQFLRTLPEQSLKGTHLTQQDTKRRLKIYRGSNVQHTGKETLQDFFVQNDIPINRIKVSQQKQLQKLLISTIQPIVSNEDNHQQGASRVNEAREAQKKAKRARQDIKQKVKRDIQAEDYRIKKENQQNEQRQILEKKSLALRKYLDVNMVPFLSEGIHEILKKLPQNPVDYLAEFLFKMSLQVPNPDPSETFEF